MNFKPGDKVACIVDFSGDHRFVHPNGAPPMGPILCVETVSLNPTTRNEQLTIVGHPVLNHTHKHLPPKPTGYNSRFFRKIVPRSEQESLHIKQPTDTDT